MSLTICHNPIIVVYPEFSGQLNRTDKSTGIQTLNDYVSYEPVSIRNQLLRITKVTENKILNLGQQGSLGHSYVNSYSLKYGKHPLVKALSFDQVQNIVEQLCELACEDADLENTK